MNPRWGAVGITVAGGVSGWVEFLLLKRGLAARIGPEAPRGVIPDCCGSPRWPPAWLAGSRSRSPEIASGPIARAAVVLTPFGLTYLLVAALAGFPSPDG